ncbi:MAG: hypothetical protein ISR75_00525 [Phycisphaerales bacterium]|nr:hypothetical protein [Planctomycetota bacterium]MBL6996906.1 hypothetical protein [Phycisphaerales bacterium]
MKNATEFAKKFKSFRRKLPKVEVVTSEHGVIGEVIYSQLLWNATSKQAATASKKLIDASVDLNDLRMNNVYETIELIGVNYPQANERAKRLKTVLNAIYKREHGVHVDSLEGAGKRDIREYFETLNGITPFVCNRVISICFDVAAMPVDDRTLDIMITNDLVHETACVVDASSWLSRQVKADDVIEAHASLHAWVETQPVRKQTASSKKKKTKSKALKKPVEKKAPKKKDVKKTSVKKKVAKKTVAKKTVAKKKATKKKSSKKAATKKKVSKKKVTKKKAKTKK